MNIKKGKAGAKFQYEASFRRKVVEELLTGQLTQAELRRKYNIASHGSLGRGLKWYQQEQFEIVSSLPMAQESEQADMSDKDKKTLQRELELAKAKIATLETMIDIAEEQFKIEIRKKSGTKPSLE